MEREGEYLEKMNMTASSFSSEEEKLLYLVNHIDEIDTYYYLASDLSKIKYKSIEFKEALKRKIIQCFIHYFSPGKYSGILTGIFENSPDLETEYLHFLEEIVAPNSVFREINYLKSIALSHPIESGSLLFSISDKVELLAYKYLLKIDPNHQVGIDFFLNYSKKTTVSRGRFYFIVIENIWSGQGIINEYGDWILHPLYELDYQPNVFHSGPARVRFIRKIFSNAKAKKTSVEYESYGNWIKPNGEFILDSLVPLPGVFSNGIASCFDPREPKYIDLEGNYTSDLEGQKKKFFEDGYSAEITQSDIIVNDAENRLLFKLDGKFDAIEFSSTDRLFLYGTFLNSVLRFGFTDLSGNVLTEPIFHTSRDHSFVMSTFKGQSKLILRKGPRLYGLINRDFKTLIPFEYEMLRIINQRYIVGRKNGDWYLFDHTGEQITIEVPKYFQEHSIRYDGEIGFVKTKEGNYIIDIDGKKVLFFENYEVENLNYGVITLRSNKQKYGLFDYSCKQLLPLVYDQLHILSEETVLAKLDNSYKAIDITTMTEYNFPNGIKHYQRKLETFRDSNFIRFVKDDHGMGMINTKGEVVVPFQFRLVTYGGEM